MLQQFYKPTTTYPTPYPTPYRTPWNDTPTAQHLYASGSRQQTPVYAPTLSSFTPEINPTINYPQEDTMIPSPLVALPLVGSPLVESSVVLSSPLCNGIDHMSNGTSPRERLCSIQTQDSESDSCSSSPCSLCMQNNNNSPSSEVTSPAFQSQHSVPIDLTNGVTTLMRTLSAPSLLESSIFSCAVKTADCGNDNMDQSSPLSSFEDDILVSDSRKVSPDLTQEESFKPAESEVILLSKTDVSSSLTDALSSDNASVKLEDTEPEGRVRFSIESDDDEVSEDEYKCQVNLNSGIAESVTERTICENNKVMDGNPEKCEIKMVTKETLDTAHLKTICDDDLTERTVNSMKQNTEKPITKDCSVNKDEKSPETSKSDGEMDSGNTEVSEESSSPLEMDLKKSEKKTNETDLKSSSILEKSPRQITTTETTD